MHNGIEYGDMQLISEAYDVLRTLGGLSNDELAAAFNEWNTVRRECVCACVCACVCRVPRALAQGLARTRGDAVAPPAT